MRHSILKILKKIMKYSISDERNSNCEVPMIIKENKTKKKRKRDISLLYSIWNFFFLFFFPLFYEYFCCFVVTPYWRMWRMKISNRRTLFAIFKICVFAYVYIYILFIYLLRLLTIEFCCLVSKVAILKEVIN